MNLWPFRSTPTPINDTEPSRSRNGQFADSPRTRRVNTLAASVKTQLGVYKATTTAEERAADAAAFFAVARSLRRSA